MTLRSRALIEAAYLALLAAVVAFPLTRIFLWFVKALSFPYALNYNEGIVWKQMVEIVAGRGYAPINRFPAIVFHYPPVFHLAAAALAETGLDPLVSGRVVSLASTAGSALLIGDLARRLTPTWRPLIARVAMVTAPIMFLLFEAVHTWVPQMRVDAIACFFAFGGLWCVTKSDERPALIYLAAACFVLSAFSKQTSIVTAAASFGALLLLRPRRAVSALAATVLLGLVVLTGLVWSTHGGLLRHLFLYNLNRFDFGRLLPNLNDGTQPFDRPLLLIGAIGYLAMLAGLWHKRSRPEPNLTTAAMLLLVPIATLSLVTTGKFGSSSSYYIQWEAALAIFGAVAVAWLVQTAFEQLARGSPVSACGLAAVPLALTLWVYHHPDSWHLRTLEAMRLQDTEIVRLLEPVTGDIISDEMAILMRMHRNVVWEPAIFAELARSGRWDERLIIDQICSHRIGAVVSDGQRGSSWFDERYNPAVAAAIDVALPRKVIVGSRVIHLPATTASSTPIGVNGGTPNCAAGRK